MSSTPRVLQITPSPSLPSLPTPSGEARTTATGLPLFAAFAQLAIFHVCDLELCVLLLHLDVRYYLDGPLRFLLQQRHGAVRIHLSILGFFHKCKQLLLSIRLQPRQHRVADSKFVLC